MRFKDHTDPFFGKRLDFGKDTYWRRRKVLMLTSHYYGRRRNCFSIAIRGLLKAMQYVTKSGRLRTKNFKELSDSRIEGSSAELNYNAWNMRETLSRLNIGLNRKESQPKSIGGMDITRFRRISCQRCGSQFEAITIMYIHAYCYKFPFVDP
ncbi:RP-L20 [Lepeophtheirus salmonis]|uniref:RP-L20 n=1 Tax=Lepeophtheirus salmonis TaxID=72036 RepID=A0A7R8HDT8_LEPSM|nr:RP-L20 [Lepeophtheirus salmonis]CAF3041363.1 RP-L20 [Lepeophtheirus salmonis]